MALLHLRKIDHNISHFRSEPLISVIRTTIFLAHDEPPSTVPFLTHPISNVTLQTYQSLISLPISYHHTLIIHHAWILMTLPQTQFFYPISQFNNSDIEIPDQFEISEPSPSRFSQPPFRPLHIPTPDELSPAPSSYTDATPILYPMTCDLLGPVDEELENELDNFITLPQQLQNPNTLTIHHLSQTIASSESSKPASTTEETRVHQLFK